MSPDPIALLHMLRDALAVLAAGCATQTALLDEHAVMPDEIALNFDDAFRVINGLAEEQVITEDIVSKLRQIDALLNGMSGQEQSERWTRAALEADEGWKGVRLLARSILTELTGNWERALPSLQVIR